MIERANADLWHILQQKSLNKTSIEFKILFYYLHLHDILVDLRHSSGHGGERSKVETDSILVSLIALAQKPYESISNRLQSPVHVRDTSTLFVPKMAKNMSPDRVSHPHHNSLGIFPTVPPFALRQNFVPCKSHPAEKVFLLICYMRV